jgi:hypothetical protein
MADFIVRHDITLEAAAVAGEIIAIDARLQDYGGVLFQHIGLNDPGDHLEIYERTFEHCKSALGEYSRTMNEQHLLKHLLECKLALADLLARE